VALLDVHDPHVSITSNLCRESGGVEMMGLEPTTPCLQSQFGRDRYLRRQGTAQAEANEALSVGVRWGPVRTGVNGTVVVIERTHAWANQYGKLRWCTERRRTVVEFWLALANAAVVCSRLVRHAWTHHRWRAAPPLPMTPTGAGPKGLR
jgi:hypothetical protein